MGCTEWQDFLMEAVRERRVIWDKTYKDYKDRCTVKEDNWEDVAKILTEADSDGSTYTVDEVKKNWENLRDTFQSNRRMYEAKLASGAGATDEPTWIWWKYFGWLRDKAQRRVTSASNIVPEISTSDVPDSPDTPSDVSTPQPATSEPKKRKKVREDEEELNEQIKTIDKQIYALSNTTTEPNDAAHYYSLSLSHQLRKLTDYQFAIARSEIDQALFKHNF